MSNWTELDVRHYIECGGITLPGLYYVHEREVFLCGGIQLAAGGVNRLRDGEQVVTRTVRYCTVGNISYTGIVEPIIATNHDIVLEVAASTLTERGTTCTDNRLSEAVMEDRKKGGYF